MKRMLARSLFGAFLLCALGSAGGKEADCSVARDPRRCEAQQAARDACADLQGQAHSACMREALPPPDCGRAPSTAQCQAKRSAEQACKGKHGKAHSKCLRESSG